MQEDALVPEYLTNSECIFPPASCPRKKAVSSTGKTSRYPPIPANTRNAATIGIGICMDRNHWIENLAVFFRQYPKGTFNKNTANVKINRFISSMFPP